jgi:hypothetical protein
VRAGQRRNGLLIGRHRRGRRVRTGPWRGGGQLRKPEVEQLDALLRHQDVGRLQVAMDDPLLVRGVERVADLDARLDGLIEGHRPGDGLAVDELHHEVAAAVVLADVVQRADVRVVERRDRLRLALEPLGERAFHGLHRDVAVETRVFGAIDVAHSPGASRLDNFVRTETFAGSKSWHR